MFIMCRFGVTVSTSASARHSETLHILYDVLLKSTIIENSSKALKLHNKWIFELTDIQEETL